MLYIYNSNNLKLLYFSLINELTFILSYIYSSTLKLIYMMCLSFPHNF